MLFALYDLYARYYTAAILGGLTKKTDPFVIYIGFETTVETAPRLSSSPFSFTSIF